MRSVPIVLSAAIGIAAALPIGSHAQTSSDQPQAQAPAQQTRQERETRHRNFRKEHREHYDKLSAADKQKVDQINQQIREHQQALQILGMTPRAHGPS